MLQKAILKTLTYRDIFDYPMTAEEVWQFLVESKASKAAVEKALAKMTAKKTVEKKDDFYFLSGREATVALRRRREKLSEEKLEKLARAARFLRLVPWAKAVFATGAVAVGNADEKADLDILVIAAPGRVWLTRLFSFFALITLGVKRKAGSKTGRDKICPNMFFAADHLALPPDERNLYTAHEVVQAKLIWERGPIHQQFLAENSWIKNFLPNAKAGEDTGYFRFAAGKKEKKVLEPTAKGSYKDTRAREKKNLFVSLFDFIEQLAYNLQLRYMASKRTIEVVTPHRILFHSIDLPTRVLDAYAKNLTKYTKGHYNARQSKPLP